LVCPSLRQRDLIVDNIGLPARSYNLAFADGLTIGASHVPDQDQIVHVI
jgi:hypothetical protein